MAYNTDVEIQRFHELISQLSSRYSVEALCPDAYRIGPKQAARSLPDKSLALTIMAITHGNETAGLAAMTEFLQYLGYQGVELHVPIAVVLGNASAARAHVRFLERDLNRSFGTQSRGKAEEKRAVQLEKVLQQSAYFLDLHQTSEPCPHPFFIFPYTRRGFDFARAISGSTAIVTHWGRPFSDDGCCTDEFVNRHGGVGISLELGQNSYHPLHVAAGYRACINALEAVTAIASGMDPKLRHPSPGKGGEIYTWAKVWPYPKGSKVELQEGMTNFSELRSGQTFGFVDGNPLIPETNGYVLFPQYRRNPSVPEPAELLRQMRIIDEHELPDL